jgi:signal peptidase II
MSRGGGPLNVRGHGAVAAIVAVIVAVDQLTKWWIAETMRVYESIPIIDGLFDLTYVRNTGAAFGLFAGLPAGVRGPFFAAISIGALVALISIFRGLGPEQRALRFALAGVLGGAVGNMIDRLRFGEVIDFLDVYWGAYHWPAFNVADSCITVGVIVLLAITLRPPRDTAPPTQSS